ncbi:MAG TPA: DMT family transporter, partial [Marmoricola sp.]|nr:DMT family transporter [Marmoricola sp.]
HLLARNWSLLVGYGLVAVAVAQLGYFNAVKHMSVSSALLMEYTAPVVVVGWMWFRHHERPSQMTWIGALLAAAGLALVLDLMSGTTVSGAGMMWGTIAMLGGATYFIISAHDNDLPPLVLAAGGLLLGGVAMCIAGLLGVVEMNMSTADVLYRGVAVPWWLPVLALCLVAAAISYVTGIIASRILGARVASFVALTEVVFAVVWAWLLIAELPGPMQLFGGCLVIAGVIVVKLGERPGTREFENPLNPV